MRVAFFTSNYVLEIFCFSKFTLLFLYLVFVMLYNIPWCVCVCASICMYMCVYVG